MTSEAEVWALFAAASLAAGKNSQIAAQLADGVLGEFHDRFVQAPEGSDNWERRDRAPAPASDEPLLDFTKKG